MIAPPSHIEFIVQNEKDPKIESTQKWVKQLNKQINGTFHLLEQSELDPRSIDQIRTSVSELIIQIANDLCEFGLRKLIFSFTLEPGYYFLIELKNNIFFSLETFILEDFQTDTYLNILHGDKQCLVRNATYDDAKHQIIKQITELAQGLEPDHYLLSKFEMHEPSLSC